MKTFKKVALVVAVLLIVGLVVAYVSLGSIVKGSVETVAPEITGTSVTVESVGVNPATGSASVANLVVGNPEGYKSAFAVRVGSCAIDIDPGTIFSNPIVIEDFVIDAAEINYELAVLKSNIGVILGNIEEAAGDSESESETKVIIWHFLLQNAKVHLPNAEETIDLPAVELEGIGEKEGGQTAAEAAKQIAGPVGEAVVKAVAESQGMGERLKERAGSAVESIKGIFK